MPPQRPLTPTSLPHLDVMLTDDGSRTLRDNRLNETFHSGCGALRECWHVYLGNSGISNLLASASQSPVRVLELGFGTGMGWLLTAAFAELHGAQLEFVSLENRLLPADVLAQIDTAAAIERGIADDWLPDGLKFASRIERDWLQYISRGAVETDTGEIAYQISPTNRLRLILGDARQWLSQAEEVEPFDAIYFDAFSPSTSPELWQSELFEGIKGKLRAGGKLVSYCVSGAVRRDFERAGFQVARHPGPPGGKREVLVCCKLEVE